MLIRKICLSNSVLAAMLLLNGCFWPPTITPDPAECLAKTPVLATESLTLKANIDIVTKPIIQSNIGVERKVKKIIETNTKIFETEQMLALVCYYHKNGEIADKDLDTWHKVILINFLGEKGEQKEQAEINKYKNVCRTIIQNSDMEAPNTLTLKCEGFEPGAAVYVRLNGSILPKAAFGANNDTDFAARAIVNNERTKNIGLLNENRCTEKIECIDGTNLYWPIKKPVIADQNGIVETNFHLQKCTYNGPPPGSGDGRGPCVVNLAVKFSTNKFAD